jgi:hypothetical protein
MRSGPPSFEARRISAEHLRMTGMGMSVLTAPGNLHRMSTPAVLRRGGVNANRAALL